MRDIIIVIGLVVLIPMILKRPYIGALAWTWIAILNPHQEAFGFSSQLRPNLLIVLVTLLSFAVSSERKMWPGGKTALVFVLFIIWTTVTSLLSPDPETAMEFWFDFVIKMAIHVIIILMIINSRHRLISLLWCFALSLGYHAVKISLVTVKSGFVIGRYTGFGPANTMIDDRNHFAVAVLMLAPLLFFLWKYASNRLMRNAALLGMICCFIAVIGSFSRGGMLTMIAMMGVLWLRTNNKLVSGTVMAAGALLLVTFAPESFKDRIESAVEQFRENESRFDDDKQLDESFCLRLAAWQLGWEMTLDRPIHGSGLRSIQNPEVATEYLQESACNGSEDYKVRAAHNIYVEVLSDSGFVGLGMFLFILVGSILHCSVIIRRTRSKPQLQWAHDLAKMLQVSLIGYAIGSTLLSFSYYDGYYLMVAMIIITGRLVSEELDGVEPRRIVNGRGAGRRDRRPGAQNPNQDVAAGPLKPA